MSAASLEIVLDRLASGGVGAFARFSPDESVTDPSLIARRTLMTLDVSALLAAWPDPEAYGRLLAAQLFADVELRSAWRRVRAAQERDRSTLRVRVRLDHSFDTLHALRWETLCDPDDGRPLALSEQVTLARSIDTNSLAAVTRPTQPELRALVAVASPSDLGTFGLADLDVDGEVARAQAAFGDIPTTVLGGVPNRRFTRVALEAAIREGPHLVSIVCHGSLVDGVPYLWLEGTDGRHDRLTGAALVEAIVGQQRPPLLLVIAACRSAGGGYGESLRALGPALARAGVPAVIGFESEVPQETVRRMLPVLYAELRRDGQIDRAIAAARRASLPDPSWWQAVLWLHVRDGKLWHDPAVQPGRDGALHPEPLAETIPRQLRLQRETLGSYLDQLARFGRAFAPPHVLGGIREARGEIKRLKGQLRSCGAAVEDHPDDGG